MLFGMVWVFWGVCQVFFWVSVFSPHWKGSVGGLPTNPQRKSEVVFSWPPWVWAKGQLEQPCALCIPKTETVQRRGKRHANKLGVSKTSLCMPLPSLFFTVSSLFDYLFFPLLIFYPWKCILKEADQCRGVQGKQKMNVYSLCSCPRSITLRSYSFTGHKGKP